jgi:hypothetical protein
MERDIGVITAKESKTQFITEPSIESSFSYNVKDEDSEVSGLQQVSVDAEESNE